MSYAQNIFTTTSPNETNFVITWTAPYYMTTADVKAEVDNASAAIDKVAWTVVSVSGTNVTLATGIPTDSTVRIYRETDVSSNEVDFLAGSPFRAGDVNLNFDQTLFAIQEALTSDENHEADIDRLEGLIDTILALLNNNIQFVQVANVAALDTAAATDPENLKGYEVVDSTGLEGANPEIPLLPPKAGTGTGEDPVTGVYWDSGISTKVLWDKANQNWIYVSYFASNGDNRYQQITLQQATAPNVADFKNGTLWFNTTDQNLYLLYDDSSTRSWVLVNPLRDDRYVNRTGDSMTGDLLMNNADVVFEGSTDDGFETTLTVTDPTADNSIVLPDVSGNVVTTGDTGTVTSTMIADATIVDADVNSSAAITLTKLGSGALPSNITVNSDNITNLSIVNDDVNANAEIEVSKLANGTARQLLQTNAAGTGVEFTSNVDVPGTLDVTSTAVFDSNVGIGTSSPVAGDRGIDIMGTTDASLRLHTGNTGSTNSDGAIFSVDANNSAYLWNYENQHFIFGTNNAERMRIDSAGRLLLNGGSDVRMEFGTNGTTGTNDRNHIRADGDNLKYNTCASGKHIFEQNGSDAMQIDSSGNVGIGTTSPTHQLTVHNASTTGGTIEANRFSTRNNYGSASGLGNGIFSPASNALAFATNSVERMRIFSDGGVNIKKYLEFRNQNDTTQAGYLGNAADLVISGSANDFALRAEVNLLFSTNGSTERMRIDSSGNVGIGTSAPRRKLEIATGGTASILLTSTTGNTNKKTWEIMSSDNASSEADLVIKSRNENSAASGGIEGLRIDSSGNVLINESSSQSNNAVTQITNAASRPTLALRTSINTGCFMLFQNPSTGYTIGRGLYVGGDSGKQGYLWNYEEGALYLGTTNVSRVQISSGGKVTAPGVYSGTTTGGGPVYVESDGDLLRYTSSLKYKTDVETLEDARADAILNCRPVWYRSKCANDIKTKGSEKSNWGWYGFIAEEIAEIEPRLVNWATKDAVPQEDGLVNSVERDPADYEAEGVRYENFVPLLLNLVKRQQSAIQTLETKVAALEAG